jgi:alkylhydroperoxidase/carboxymuconolactone decarboxylase family protein YurZ
VILTPEQVADAARVRAELFGSDVRRPEPEPGEPGNAPELREILSRPFSDSWARAGLPLRTKSVSTISMLIALGAHDELQKHFVGALRLGISPDEIVELLIHSAGYCGVPRAHAAYQVLLRLLRERAPAAR